MGAQGFPETDYTPDTESNLNYQMDMLLFPELQSEHDAVALSEYPGGQSQKKQDQKGEDDITKGITIESILDPHFPDEQHARYLSTFKIKFETQLGESLCVIGEIEELGSWKNFVGKMKWTEGHIWVLEDLMIKSKSFFSYKYVLMKNEQPEIWEKGQNRIADLRILPDQRPNATTSVNILREPSHLAAVSKDSKRVELFDTWESFSVKFSIYYPVENEQLENIHISGSLEQLGRDSKTIKMQKPSNYYGSANWLQSKYGQEVRPWEYQITFDDTVMKGDRNLPIEFTYKYFIVHDQTGHRTSDKMKTRRIVLQPPETYTGVKTRDGQMNTDKLWIVNGVAHKVEGNFTSNTFSCTEIGRHGIYIGDYPQGEDDFQGLHNKGIKTIINLMADDEIEHRQINLEKVMHICSNNEMKYQRIPLNDFSDGQYCFDLTSAVKELARALNQGKVFVHCSSGVSRSPTLALTYLCLYKKIEDWRNPESSAHYLKQFCKGASPNVKVIQQVFQRLLNTNSAFQKMMKSSFQKSPEQEIVKSAQIQLIKTSSEIPPHPRKIQPLNTAKQVNLGYETSSAITHRSQFKEKPRSRSQMSRASSAPWDDDGQISHTSDSPAVEEQLRQQKEDELIKQRKQELELKQQMEKERRLKEAEEARLEAERQKQQALLELERRRQMETESMLKSVEEKIRKEMEESLRLQQAEAAKRLAQREEEQKQEIEQLRGAVLAEKEQKRKMKEIKKQMRLEEQARQFERETEEKQKLLDEISQRMNEVEQLKKQLQDEAGNRQKIELEKMKKQKDLEEILEKQREAAEKEKEEAIKLYGERENEEIQELNAIQEQLTQANEKKRFRRSQKRQNKLELLQIQKRERELEKLESMRVAEEIKQKKLKEGELDLNKAETDFDMEADRTIGVIDDSKINEEQPKSVRENGKDEVHMVEEPVISPSSPEVEKEAGEQQQDTEDEVETDNIQFASGSERDSANEERKDAQLNDEEVLSNQSKTKSLDQLQANENDQKFVEELARIAKIADDKRIAQLAQVQKEQLEAEARQQQIQLLAKEKLRKEEEAEEARRALEEIQAIEAEQLRIQEERDAILVQKAVEQAKLLMQQEEEAKKQKELEAKDQREQERLMEIEKRDEIIEQLQTKLKQQMEVQEQEEIQKANEMKLIKEESARFAAEALKAIERAEREERARRELEEAEKQAKLEAIRLKEEEERMQREAQEALEKAQRLQAELEEAEQQAQNRALIEAAIARIAGEMIIDRVEAEILDFYNEEVHEAKTKELEALQRAQEEAERQRMAEIEELLRAEEGKYQELLRQREEEQERLKRLQEANHRQNTNEEYETAQNKAAEPIKQRRNESIANESSQKQQDQVELDFKRMMQEQQQKHEKEEGDNQKRLGQLAQSFDIPQNQVRNEHSIDETITDILGSCRNNQSSNQQHPRKQMQASIDEKQECYYEEPRAPEIEYSTRNVKEARNQRKEEQKVSLFPDTYYSVQKMKTQNQRESFEKGSMISVSKKSTDAPFRYTYENLAHLFQGDRAPIPYHPRRGNQVDEQIAQILRKKGVKVPVANIKPGLYLIGCNRCNVDMKLNSVSVKIGGGSARLEDYLAKNEAAMQATLIDQMVKTNTELDGVIEKIIQGKKVSMCSGLLAERNNSKNTSGIKPASPTRSAASLSGLPGWRSTSPLRRNEQRRPQQKAQRSTVIVAPYMQGRGSPQLSPARPNHDQRHLRNTTLLPAHAQSYSAMPQGSASISPFRKSQNQRAGYRGSPTSSAKK